MAKEAEGLLSLLNEIDTTALAEGAPLFGKAWEVEKTAMWRKGLAVLKFYPELEEQIDKPGRPRKNAASAPHSFAAVARAVGRDPTRLASWVKMVVSIGKTEKELKAWLEAAQQPVIEGFQMKLLAVDDGKTKKELEKPLAIKDLDLLQIEERIKAGCETEADVKWLVKRCRALAGLMGKALQALLDEKPKRAVELLEKGTEE